MRGNVVDRSGCRALDVDRVIVGRCRVTGEDREAVECLGGSVVGDVDGGRSGDPLDRAAGDGDRVAVGIVGVDDKQGVDSAFIARGSHEQRCGDTVDCSRGEIAVAVAVQNERVVTLSTKQADRVGTDQAAGAADHDRVVGGVGVARVVVAVESNVVQRGFGHVQRVQVDPVGSTHSVDFQGGEGVGCKVEDFKRRRGCSDPRVAGDGAVENVDRVATGVAQYGQRAPRGSAGRDRLEAGEVELQVRVGTVVVGEDFTL